MATRFDRIRVLFPDHFGIARGKYLPTKVLGERDDHAVSKHCITLFAQNLDKTMVAAPGARLLEGMPDCEATFSLDEVRPSWEDERTGVVVADLSFRGEPLAMAPRTALRRTIGDLRTLGYDPQVGIELEAYVLESDGAGGWRPWHTPGAMTYGTGRAVDPVGLFDDLMWTADACGLPIESVNSEYDAPQFELTLHYRDALGAADDVFLFKLMAREVAHRHGLLLTFLGKPMEATSGSGLHVNASLRTSAGANALSEASAPDGLSTVARHAIAGLLAHHEALAGLLAPTVNAYKRLRPGQLSGYWANWGLDHRCATVRIPYERGMATRIEHRMADGAANVHTAVAAVLAAMRLGIEAGEEPPPPEDTDALEVASTERHTPADLAAALDALEADTALVEAVGAELVAQFVAVKRDEWEKFTRAVTDWELRTYLPFF